MVQKIDYEALRAAVRQQYIDHPTNGDPVLELEQRAADLIADFAVFTVKEVVERKTPMDVLLMGMGAILSIPMENLINNEGLDRLQVTHYVANAFANYLMGGDDIEPDSVVVPRVEVGDA